MRSTLIRIAATSLVQFLAVTASLGQSQFVRTTNFFPVADATIRSDAPDNNFGGAPFVMAGVINAGAGLSRGLIRFDLSGLPTNATVSNATLTVVGVNLAVQDYFRLSRVLTDWSEADVTWDSPSLFSRWYAPGGQIGADFFGSYSSSSLVSAPGTNQFTDNPPHPGAGLVYDTQLWISQPTQNYGWILQALNEGPNGSLVELGSGEDPGNQPVLTVGYTLPFTPPVLTLVSSGGGQFCFSINIEPYHGYGIQRCSDLSRTNWVNLLTLDPPPYPQEYQLCFPMTTNNMFYRIGYF